MESLREELITIFKNTAYLVHAVPAFQYKWIEKKNKSHLVIWPDDGSNNSGEPDSFFVCASFIYMYDDLGNLKTDFVNVKIFSSYEKNTPYEQKFIINSEVSFLLAKRITFWISGNKLWDNFR